MIKRFTGEIKMNGSECSVVQEDWKNPAIVSLHKGKGEVLIARTKDIFLKRG